MVDHLEISNLAAVVLRVVCHQLIQFGQQLLVELAQAAQSLLLPQILNHHENFFGLGVQVQTLVGLSVVRMLHVVVAVAPNRAALTRRRLPLLLALDSALTSHLEWLT